MRFLSAQATTTGVISIRQGYSKFGPRGVLEQLLLWRDLTDDGRYVIPLDGAPVAVGIGAKRLARLVDDSIDVVVDRLETHWETGDALPQGDSGTLGRHGEQQSGRSRRVEGDARRSVAGHRVRP